MEKAKWKSATQVAAIHTHFNIFRDINEVEAGDVTRAEQIKAMQRFVRWHERQARVGRALLERLVNEEAASEPTVVAGPQS